MLSLHTVTEDVRGIIKWGLIGLAGLIVLIILFNIVASSLFKPKPLAATLNFGILPPIPFPKNTISQPLTYVLETVDGTTNSIDPTTNQVKTIPGIINIYKIIQTQPGLTSLQTAQNKAQTLGFVDQTNPSLVLPEQRISETEYQWDKSWGLQKTLSMDITSDNFHLTSQFMTYPAVLSSTNAPTDASAVSTVQSILSTLQLVPADIDSTLTTTTDYVIVNGIIRQAQTGENVMAVRVNLFQSAINNYPIFYPNNPDTTMSFLITGGDTQSEIAQATFVHQSVDTTSYATYPLKTSDQAYADLKTGKATYITPSYTGGGTVTIRTVNFGYYIGENPQQYLMPVFVFQGDNNFTAYVSAVSDAAIGTAPTPTGM